MAIPSRSLITITKQTYNKLHTQSNIEDKGPTIPIHFILGNVSQHGSAFIEVAETSRVVWQSLGYLGALKGFFIHYKSKSEINSLDASTSTVYTHTVLSQWRGLPMAALTSHIMWHDSCHEAYKFHLIYRRSL